MDKRKILIIAGCLCLVGSIAAGAGFTMMDFNVKELSRTAKDYRQMNKVVKKINEKKDIKLDFRHHNIYVVPSNDEDMHITYFDKKDTQEYVTEENKDMFAIRYKESKEFKLGQFFKFSIFDEEHNVEVRLPRNYKGNLDINTTFGEVDIKGFREIGDLHISTTNDNVVLHDIKTAKSMNISTTHGMVEGNDLNANQIIDMSSTHDNVSLKNIKAQALLARTTYGQLDVQNIQSASNIQLSSTHENILMKNVYSKERIDVQTTYGLLRFDNVDAKELRLETSHEDIHGNISGALQEYQVAYSISHGDSNIAETNQGNKKLYLKTTYGDINVSFDS